MVARRDAWIGAERASLILRFFGWMQQSSKQYRYECEQEGDSMPRRDLVFVQTTRSRS